MTKIKKKPADPRAKLTRDLKKWVSDFDALNAKMGRLRCLIFAHTYQWVTYTAEHDGAKDVKAGCVRLANTLRRSYTSVEGWFYCGKFMRESGINPRQADSQSVRAVWMRRGVLSKAEQLKCIDLIRKGRPYSEVAKVVRNSMGASKKAAVVKARLLRKKGEMNKTRMKMELMALHTLMTSFYGAAVKIKVIRESNGKVLMETK